MSTRLKLATNIVVEEEIKSVYLQNAMKSVEQYLKESLCRDTAAHENALELITDACVDILLHGLLLVDATHASIPTTSLNKSERTASPNSNVDTIFAANCNTLLKLIEDFEWLRRSTQIGEALIDWSSVPQSTNICPHGTVQQFLRSWTLCNLRSNCLCVCLQSLVTDKELLECHYGKGAFLRNEMYATAYFICLSALEINQCSLLTQVQPSLCTSTTTGVHKRTNSNPDFLVSTSNNLLNTVRSPTGGGANKNITNGEKNPTKLELRPVTTEFLRIRKVKSLPLLSNEEPRRGKSSFAGTPLRPRSKTLSVVVTAAAPTQPKNIPTTILMRVRWPINTTSSSSYSGGEDEQPSTSSANSKQCHLSDYAKPSPLSCKTGSTSVASSSTSVSSSSSTTTGRRIELIKCDDIKIWTDHSWDLKQQQQQQQHSQSTPEEPTTSCYIPENTLIKHPKSISPINNFLCNIFGTTPTYASWSNSSLSNDEIESMPASALDVASYPCNTQQLNSSSGMFESFRPVYGKKLRSRKSQNMFDESAISSLDYSSTVADDSTVDTLVGEGDAASTTSKTPSKDCQSLTVFLQMAHSTTQRNNTELEKENAHFRISEAIISAMEHIKWTRQGPESWRRESETITATDWLEKDQNSQQKRELLRNVPVGSSTLSSTEANESIPYQEQEECFLDALSAEVLGLSLIAKFNDEHLPKVSELKWLVSEEDAPQQLLPLPDTSSTSNPDENVAPSVMRGTRYWAPPRQQIIFTDHPPPNRKELIRKQNNRCSGCGMRVSPQHIQSFRYCTYLGKYHCTGCHRNQMSAIPAKILQSWDFKCYPVSVFAYRLLEQMYTYPLFHVPDLNPALYIRSKVLLSARNKRVKLKFVNDFIYLCRFAVREQRYFSTVPTHITHDPDIWSVCDFMDAHEKSMQRSIDDLFLRCENHIFNCVLCTARGFICECCRKDHVIYPWQSKVFRCDHCGSCFHQSCWKAMLEVCCRCQRINKRQVEISDNEYESEAKVT